MPPKTPDPVDKMSGLLSSLQKKFGDNVVKRGSEVELGAPISSGSLHLDFATGYGGFPSNRVVEIYGREGTGKTTLALLCMLNALRANPDRNALFIDMEHKITPEWLEMIVGPEVVHNRLMYVSAKTIEHATNIYRVAVDSGLICCAILDSIGGAPTIRRNDDAETALVGGNAIGVGHFAQTAATYSDTMDCLTIGINQVTTPIGKMAYNDETPGGHKWKHACVLRIELVRDKRENEFIRMPGEEHPVPIGYLIRAKVRKNQVGAPGRVAQYWFYNVWTEQRGWGVDQIDEINRLSLATGVISQRGGWYHHPAFPVDAKGEHKIQGAAGMMAAIRGDASLQSTIASEVMACLKDTEKVALVSPASDPEGPIVPTEAEGGAINFITPDGTPTNA